MVDSAVGEALGEGEYGFLRELHERGVRFMIVGASAALLQGATTATQDVDLWFEDTSDQRIGEAARAVGGIWVSGSFGSRPPALGGEALGDRFDVVTHMHGLEDFKTEYAGSIRMALAGTPLRVLPLRRVIASKRAAGRKKDLAQIPALEETLAVLEAEQS